MVIETKWILGLVVQSKVIATLQMNTRSTYLVHEVAARWARFG